MLIADIEYVNCFWIGDTAKKIEDHRYRL